MQRLAFSTVFALLAAGTAPALADTTYDFTEISDPADVTFTQLLGIDNAGIIAGYFGSGAAGHPNQGFTLLQPATFNPENFPDAAQTQVIAINSGADTAGFFVDQAGTTHGFLRIGNDIQSVDAPGTTFNQLLGLNDKEVAAGYFQDAAGLFHAYTTIGGSFTPVTFDGAVSTQATGINNAGVIAGFNLTSATTADGFVLDGTALTLLDFPGAPMTQALGINNSGQVVGSYVDANGGSHGFLYTLATGSYESIDEPNGGGTTVVNGINDAGQIVGFFVDGNGNTIGFSGVPTVTAPVLAAAVLPGARSVEADKPATVFATMLNTSAAPLTNCQITLPASAPAGLVLNYQTTDPATNAPTGQPTTPVTIQGNGAQSFVLTLASPAALQAPGTAPSFACDGGVSAPLVPGVDTIDLVFSANPIADVIALAATPTNNGIVAVPFSQNQAAAFAVATANAGADGTLTVSADTGASTQPVTLTLCQTDSTTGACLAAPSPTAQLDFAPGATPTFSVFVTAAAPIALDPGVARVFVRFIDGNGESHGSTSVALATD
jgi:probable HAF family extracellular repeat protein